MRRTSTSQGRPSASPLAVLGAAVQSRTPRECGVLPVGGSLSLPKDTLCIRHRLSTGGFRIQRVILAEEEQTAKAAGVPVKTQQQPVETFSSSKSARCFQNWRRLIGSWSGCSRWWRSTYLSYADSPVKSRHRRRHSRSLSRIMASHFHHGPSQTPPDQ